MLDAEAVSEIRRLHYAEHWKVGTIVAQLGVHPDAVLAAEQKRWIVAIIAVRSHAHRPGWAAPGWQTEPSLARASWSRKELCSGVCASSRAGGKKSGGRHRPDRPTRAPRRGRRRSCPSRTDPRRLFVDPDPSRPTCWRSAAGTWLGARHGVAGRVGCPGTVCLRPSGSPYGPLLRRPHRSTSCRGRKARR